MKSDGKVIISTKLDNSGFSKGVSGLQTAMSGLGKAMGLALGGVALVTIGKQAVQLASDIAEVQNVVDTSFGSMSYKLEEFAKTAIETAGMSKLSAKQMASTFMAMSVGMGQAVETGSDKAVEMTQRLGDVMSFYNKTLGESDTIGRAVYSGETEPLKQIGVIMNQSSLELFAMQNGYKQLYKDMDAANQLLVRQEFFLNATRLAAGDFVKTQDGWANQTRILSERWKEFMSIIGQSLITVLKPVVQGLNAIVAAMIQMANTFNAIITGIFGGTNKQIEQVKNQATGVAGAIGESVDNQDALTDATKNTGKAAKSNLSTFDELNVLQKDSAAGGAGNGAGSDVGATAPIISEKEVVGEIPALVAKIQKLLEPLKQISFDNLSVAFDRLKAAVAPITQTMFEGLEWGYNNVLVPLAQWTIEDAMPVVIEMLADAVGYFEKNIELLKPFAMWLWENFLKPLGQWTGETFVAALEGYRVICAKIMDWIEANKEKIQELFTVLAPLAQIIADTILVTLDNIRTFALTVFQNVVDILIGIVDFVVGVLTGDWSKAWEGLQAVVMGVVNIIVALFMQMWKTLTTNFTKGLEALKAIWNLIWGAIKNILVTTWDAMTSTFTGTINNWIGVIENFANFFVSMINKIIEGINQISFELPDWDILGEYSGLSLGFNIPTLPPLKLPRLAAGAVLPANREFMAVLGDQKHGRNLEAPEGLIRQIIREEMPSSAAGESRVVLNVDGRVLGEFIIGYINGITEQTNISPILV